MKVIFYINAFFSLVFALGVILGKNPLRSALSLLLFFLTVSLYFFFAGSEYLGFVQIVVYAGGIIVLIVFVIIVLGLRRESMDFDITARSFVGITLTALFGLGVIYGLSRTVIHPKAVSPYFDTSVAGIGDTIFSRYLLPFELASILLLVGVVLAFFFAKKEV